MKRGLLATAAIICLLGLAVYLVTSRWRRIESHDRRAAQEERTALQRKLSTTMHPVAFLGSTLEERLAAGETLTKAEVEQFIEGYTGVVDEGTTKCYFYFVVRRLLFGRWGAWIRVEYSPDGVAENVSWDTGDPLSMW